MKKRPPRPKMGARDGSMGNIVQKTKDKLMEYEKRHQGILGAAMRLFNTNGYAATTTASIAKEAGVTEKTMYRHFSNKQVLFAECVFSITRDLARIWDEAQEQNPDDNLAYLKAVSRAYARFVIDNPDKSMFLVHLYSYRVIPELDEGFRDFVQNLLDETEAIIRSLKKKRTVKSSIHPRVLAGVFIGQYFTNVFLNEFLGPDLFSPEVIARLTASFLEID